MFESWNLFSRHAALEPRLEQNLSRAKSTAQHQPQFCRGLEPTSLNENYSAFQLVPSESSVIESGVFDIQRVIRSCIRISVRNNKRTKERLTNAASGWSYGTICLLNQKKISRHCKPKKSEN